MVNPTTAQLEGEIRKILNNLKQSTEMTDEELDAHRDAIKKMDFNALMLLDTVLLCTDCPKCQKTSNSSPGYFTSNNSQHIADWNRRPPLQQM